MKNVIADPHKGANANLVNRITLVRGKLTEQEDVDAFISFLTRDLSWGSALNKRLLEQAGDELDDYVVNHIIQPKSGQVFVTPSFDLPCESLIFGIMPVWEGGFDNEARYLLQCYRGAIEVAANMGLERIAFPALGKRKHYMPHKRAARLALQGIMERMTSALKEVRIVCTDDEIARVYYNRLRQKGWNPHEAEQAQLPGGSSKVTHYKPERGRE